MRRISLKLYVTGNTPRSKAAIARLQAVCDERFKDRHVLTVVDVLRQPHVAQEDGILATPTLIKEMPPPTRRVIGDLSDTEKLLRGMGLSPHG